jgi:hypothetical protein
VTLSAKEKIVVFDSSRCIDPYFLLLTDNWYMAVMKTAQIWFAYRYGK